MSNGLDAALYARLSGTSAITTALGGTAIYHLQAPDLAALPFVVFSWAGGGNTNMSPASGQEVVEFIRCYASTAAAAGSVDSLILTALHNKPLAVGGAVNFLIMREDDFESVETQPNGELIFAAGGSYRICLT